jgi:hypothetical protein
MDTPSTTPFTVIEGGRDKIEHQLVKLLFTPGLTPKGEYRRLMKLLEPSSNRVSLTTVGQESPRQAVEVQD